MDNTDNTYTAENTSKKKLIIGGVVGLLIIALIVAFFLRGGDGGEMAEQEVSTLDPINTTLDFYSDWFDAVKATSTDPYQEGLAEEPILSPELRERLADAEGRAEGEPDPVLCQSTVPEQIAGRSIYEGENQAQVMVSGRGENLTGEQAIVTLLKHNDGWYIDAIDCSRGESGVEGEFDLETEGHLLKDSLPEPYDSQNWHLVFEQNGQPGHVVPLFFDEESVCGESESCDQSQFTEASKAFVQGDMTEAGLEVKRLDLVE